MADFSQFLVIDATQGGADAFVEASVATEIIPADGLALLIENIEIVFAPASFSGLAADSEVFWSICRDTKLAVAEYSDPDCFLMDGFEFALNASGSSVIQNRWTYTPKNGIPIVEPYIYVQFDSTGTGNAKQMYVRLEYSTVKMSEVEILRILNG